MAFSPEQQAANLIQRARQILVITKEHATIDAIASTLALGLFLKKLNKNFDLVIPGYDAKRLPHFLPTHVPIQSEIGALRALHIKVNIDRVPLSNLQQEIKDGVLNLTLLPEQGSWNPQDVSFAYGDDRYDLVIALDAPDMMSLGQLRQEHIEALQRTPIVNIDAHGSNEYWGQMNLLNLTAAGSSEILFDWFQMWNAGFIDQEIATCLLTGLIAHTKSFRSPNVTPKTLNIASHLMNLGAKREEIVQGIWRRRSIDTLNIWGRALSRLSLEHHRGFAWTTLTEQDFLETHTSPEHLDAVIEELVSYSPETRAIAFALHSEGRIRLHIHALPPFSAVEIGRVLNARGTREKAIAEFSTISPLEDTKKAIEKIRQNIPLSQ